MIERVWLGVGLSAIIVTSAAAGGLTGRSTLGDWENSRGDEQMALARDMLARTSGGNDARAVDLMFCIEKVAGDPANANLKIGEIAAACLVLMDAGVRG